ncbi:MAG: beta-ketoacyl-[acyl-carrier-protein] synthase family protein [Pirellulaceae bacterium]|nr:beta-ketoacyl-[acyl-carrier-protein] synthase family protein [Pirellulaceae bacterium]
MVLIDTRIAVTGSGICSAIGNSTQSVVENLLAGRSGIVPYNGDGNERMVSRFAGLNTDFQLDDRFAPQLKHWWDRATQMGAVAAADAVAQSGILQTSLPRQRIGMAVGVSGAGQFSPSRDAQTYVAEPTVEIAELLQRRNVPHFQLYQIARWLQINGPMTCICSASAGSGIAMGNASRWLLARKADAVVAGGGEAIQLLNFLGFDTLGLLSAKPCSPFSDCDGMTMGEGAAFVVLERYEDAVNRKANILGCLLGFAVTSDAFDPILYDPTGDGIRRAMKAAIADANMQPSDVEWIRASGAGGKDQDASEIMAIRAVFGEQVPMVTSTEAHFGHCNGAGPAMGFVAAIGVQQEESIPPTLNYATETFPNIDFVPGTAKKKAAKCFLSTTAAFGGANVVMVGSRTAPPATLRELDDVVISGMGIVSGFGCAGADFVSRIGDTETYIGPINRKDLALPDVDQAGLVQNFSFRREVPSVQARGVDLLTQYAAASVRKALTEAEASGSKFDSKRLGIVTGLTSSSGTMLEKLMSEIQGPWATPTVGRTLLNKGRFLVASRIANWFGCKGYNATHSGGIGCGQVALNQAFEQLRQSPELDAIVVVASDEISRIHMLLYSTIGWLAKSNQSMLPYDASSNGMRLGEGAVAVVLERKSSIAKRGGSPLAQLDSAACSLDNLPFASSYENGMRRHFQQRSDAACLEFAVRDCFSRSTLATDSVDLVLGLGLGIPAVDAREEGVVSRVFPSDVAFGSTSSLTGVRFSSGALFNLCLAVSAMHNTKASEVINRTVVRPRRRHLQQVNAATLLGTSEDGHNIVTLVKRPT